MYEIPCDAELLPWDPLPRRPNANLVGSSSTSGSQDTDCGTWSNSPVFDCPKIGNQKGNQLAIRCPRCNMPVRVCEFLGGLGLHTA